jgi:hypothetical protein
MNSLQGPAASQHTCRVQIYSCARSLRTARRVFGCAYPGSTLRTRWVWPPVLTKQGLCIRSCPAWALASWSRERLRGNAQSGNPKPSRISHSRGARPGQSHGFQQSGCRRSTVRVQKTEKARRARNQHWQIEDHRPGSGVRRLSLLFAHAPCRTRITLQSTSARPIHPGCASCRKKRAWLNF